MQRLLARIGQVLTQLLLGVRDVLGDPLAPLGAADVRSELVAQHVWCRDWYAADYYRWSPAANPQGPMTGVRRSSRGGSWRHQLKVTRCAARSSLPPDRTFTDYGFRVALSAE